MHHSKCPNTYCLNQKHNKSLQKEWVYINDHLHEVWSIWFRLIVDVEPPLDLRLVIEADDEVGHELEEVLPQA